MHTVYDDKESYIEWKDERGHWHKSRLRIIILNIGKEIEEFSKNILQEYGIKVDEYNPIGLFIVYPQRAIIVGTDSLRMECGNIKIEGTPVEGQISANLVEIDELGTRINKLVEEIVEIIKLR